MSALELRRSSGVRLSVPLERYELKCGAQLLVSPRPGAPVTALELHLKGGPSQDPVGREGTAYLTSALLSQGTETWSEEELAAQLEPMGAQIIGSAFGLAARVEGKEWKALAAIFADMILRPTFPADRVKLQKQRLQHRLLVERENPQAQARLAFRRLIYGDHWLGRAAYGSLESVVKINSRALRAHHRRAWVSNRATLAVCGDVEGPAVKRLFDRLLKGWAPGKELKLRKPVFPKRGRRVALQRADRRQVHVFMGHLGIRRSDPDYPALVVLDHVLGTGPGFTNRIARRLRDELGLAYSVHASISSSAGVSPGTFTAYIGTSPENVSTAIAGFLEEMRRIQEEPVSEAELELVKGYLIGSFPMGYERAARRASYLIASRIHNFPDDYLETLPRAFEGVTPEDIQRVAQKHLHPGRCCLSASGPVSKKELSDALRGTGLLAAR